MRSRAASYPAKIARSRRSAPHERRFCPRSSRARAAVLPATRAPSARVRRAYPDKCAARRTATRCDRAGAASLRLRAVGDVPNGSRLPRPRCMERSRSTTRGSFRRPLGTSLSFATARSDRATERSSEAFAESAKSLTLPSTSKGVSAGSAPDVSYSEVSFFVSTLLASTSG